MLLSHKIKGKDIKGHLLLGYNLIKNSHEDWYS